MSKLRLQLPELHYATVEVEFDGTIGDALNSAYLEAEGSPVGELEYAIGLDAEEFPIRMIDEDGNVEARYWYDSVLDSWENVPAFDHGSVGGKV